MDINEIIGRYTSRIIGIFAATFAGITAYPELAWPLITLAAITIIGYIASKKWGINGNGPTRKPVRVPPVEWKGPITDEHLADIK